MTKTSGWQLVSDRFGYGPLIIPPLLIITVLSMSFLYVESRTFTPTKSTASASKPSTSGKKFTNSQLAPGTYKQFQAMTVIAPPAAESAPAASAPAAAPATASPQNSATNGTQNTLQSATQSNYQSTQTAKRSTAKPASDLKVNSSDKQKLNNKK